MRKKFIYLLVSVLVCLSVNDVFGQYSFSVASNTYQRLVNPIPINNGNVWTRDSNYVINYNFPFLINNQTFTSVTVNAGGGISFSGTNQLLTVFNHTDSGLMLEDRGSGSNSQSPITYKISGVLGQRILKIEWENAGFRDWCPPSPANDFASFQVWLYENSSRIEIHFGNSFANLSSYGNPTCNTGTQGTQIKFYYNGCANAYSLTGQSSSPTWTARDHCSWQPSVYIIGTPSSGTVYQITPSITSLSETEIQDFNLYPTPTKGGITLLNLSQDIVKEVVLVDIQGKERRVEYVFNEGNLKINLESLSNGIYFLKVTTINNNTIIERVIKS